MPLYPVWFWSPPQILHRQIGLAKDVSTSGRVKFLEKIQSCLPDTSLVVAPDTNSVEEIIVDATPGEMQDLEAFLPAWKKALSQRGTGARSAVLLLEAVNRLEGISGVSKLARKWKNSQPQGYLFWLNILKNENDSQGLVKVSKEGLKALKEGKPREREYYNEKYNRFSAFRREVKAVVIDSELLRNSGFLT